MIDDLCCQAMPWLCLLVIVGAATGIVVSVLELVNDFREKGW